MAQSAPGPLDSHFLTLPSQWTIPRAEHRTPPWRSLTDLQAIFCLPRTLRTTAWTFTTAASLIPAVLPAIQLFLADSRCSAFETSMERCSSRSPIPQEVPVDSSTSTKKTEA